MCAPIVCAVDPQDGQVVFGLDLPPDLPCFQGHFPGFPVLAGVVQLDWVMRLAATHLACGQPCATDFQIKFKRVILPGSSLTLLLRHDPGRGRLDFVYHLGDLIASQGRVILARP